MVDTVMTTLLITFLIITVFISIISSRKEDTEGFLIANRELNTFQSVMTLCGSFIGAMSLLVYPAFVFTYGISCMWIFIGYLLGFIFFTSFALHLRKYKHAKHFYTMTDYFLHRFGRKTAFFVISIIFTSYFGALTVQVIGSGKILVELTGLTYNTSVLIIMSIIIIYLLIGGFKSVVKTDIFQFIILGIFIIIFASVIRTGLQVPITHMNPFNAGPVKTIAFLLLGLLGLFANQGSWQKVYAMKNEKVVKKSFIISGILLCLMAFILTYIGLIARTQFPAIDPDLAVLYSFTKLIPHPLSSIVATAFFAAILSSADTNLFILGLNLTNDIFHIRENKRYYTRLSVLGVGLASLLLALYFTRLVEMAIVVKSIGLILAPIILSIWLTKGDRTGIIYSIVLTLILVVGIAMNGFLRPELSLIAIFGSALFYWGTVGIKKLFSSS